MSTTRTAVRTIGSANADPELVNSLLAARSESEASVAFSLLRYSLTDRELVQLVNLREVLRQVPNGPFRTGEPLELLERAGGFEATGRSYRRAYESDSGQVFGVEFLGEGHHCRGIVVHTPRTKFALRPGEWSTVNEKLLPTLLKHPMLLDAILEGLEMLGMPLTPIIYVRADDFLAEHHVENLRDTLGGLF